MREVAYRCPEKLFTPLVIEKRKPISCNAKRAGWVGANILLARIPIQGRIFVVKDAKSEDKDAVVRRLNSILSLDTKTIKARGWLMDVLGCINDIASNEFSLADVYSFERYLAGCHAENRNIKAKIRQQLQILRDKSFIEFIGRGHYRKADIS